MEATFVHVEPDICPIDFEGVHMILTGPLAWFYRLFQTMKCEEAAQYELYPYLKSAKNEWLEKKNSVTTPDNAVPAIGQYEIDKVIVP